MTTRHCFGWDIGGAHLKVAELAPDGAVVSAAQYATPLWNGLQSLDGCLSGVSRARSTPDVRHAVTMTGELVDFFTGRQAGVTALLEAFVRHFPEEHTVVFGGPLGFLPVSAARAAPDNVASANWLATTLCAAGRIERGVLVDVGSTTTDIVPFAAHQPCNRGWNDQERLSCDELVYTGIVRTPVMALVQRVPFAGRWQNIAAEFFATAADVYRITGELDDAADLHESADRRGKSVAESIARLARMLGAEARAGAEEAGRWRQVAEHIAAVQLRIIERAFTGVLSSLGAGLPVTVVGAGSGSFLARKLAQRHGCGYVSFPALFESSAVAPEAVATCAPAIAVAELARRARLQ
ncbi:MAG: hypothetical protein HYR49_02005 [Gammaproteobacteria bacterium]|nr:hypothetical protein [Gammaproteobacteria bacterium]